MAMNGEVMTFNYEREADFPKNVQHDSLLHIHNINVI